MQSHPPGNDEWINVFDIVAELKFTNGRISSKPDAQTSINRTLLESLYEDSK